MESSDVNASGRSSFEKELLDCYLNSILPEIWDLKIGDTKKRTNLYREFMTKLFKDNGCHHILDAACGNGIDSIMLIKEGFRVTSVDASFKMLKYAQDARWERHKEAGFDSWEIKRGNWLTLTEDLAGDGPYDAVLCLGNSICGLMDPIHLRLALSNMAAMVKPGGLFLTDHNNFEKPWDEMGNKDGTIYFSGPCIKVTKTTVSYENGQPCLCVRDFKFDITMVPPDVSEKYKMFDGMVWQDRMFPHQMANFKKLLQEVFGPSAKYDILGDYKALNQIEKPTTFTYVVRKPA